MIVLGLSCFYHDSAAALIESGRIIAAAQEERFSRLKHDPRFPTNAIRWCLEERGLQISDVDAVSYYDKPFLTFDRLIETYLTFAPRGFKSFAKSMPLWMREKLFQKKLLLDKLKEFDPEFSQEKLLFSEHHLSHAASSFYPSPFDEALIITLDGVGEWTTAAVSVGCGARIEIKEEIQFPHSLGLLYSAFTYYLGFKVNSGEYKVMGLAPYGQPKYRNLIKERLIQICDDGSFWMDQDFFDYCTGLTMTNDRFAKLFGRKARDPNEELDEFHMDLASSIQSVTEEVVLKIARHKAKQYNLKNLCLAGGVALNCVANGKILKEKIYEDIWIQPASGDAGGALGAAQLAYYDHFGNEREVIKPDAMEGAYLGPSFGQQECERRLKNAGAKLVVLEDEELCSIAAADLAQDKVVGWFQGRMEFGPRALGNRSILGNPLSSKTQETMNLKIKFRESFRPFAPSVLREEASQWFDMDVESPYMLLVAEVSRKKRLEVDPSQKLRTGLEKLKQIRTSIPAVTHVDFSARVQTVDRDRNPRYHALITAFKEKTGCGVIVNTSFNVRGEPIVCTPEDAFRCFMGTNMDVLVVGNCYMKKTLQDPTLQSDYKESFDLD